MSREDYLIDRDRKKAGFPSLWETAEERVRRQWRDRTRPQNTKG